MSKIVVVACHGLIQKNNRYLVTKRADTNDYMPGFWDLPGGTIEFGEDIQKALIREIKEEVGLKIALGPIIYAYSFISSPSRHQYQFIYQCKYLSGKVKLNPEEHSDYQWLTIKEMKPIKKINFLKNYHDSLRKTK